MGTWPRAASALPLGLLCAEGAAWVESEDPALARLQARCPCPHWPQPMRWSVPHAAGSSPRHFGLSYDGDRDRRPCGCCWRPIRLLVASRTRCARGKSSWPAVPLHENARVRAESVSAELKVELRTKI